MKQLWLQNTNGVVARGIMSNFIGLIGKWTSPELLVLL